MVGFDKHIFICTNKRPEGDPRGCCSSKGSEIIRDFFKEEIKKLGLKGRVRANASGCIDQCSQGPAVVIYPEGVWYRVPSVTDAREIVESHIKKGIVVERLLMK